MAYVVVPTATVNSKVSPTLSPSPSLTSLSSFVMSGEDSRPPSPTSLASMSPKYWFEDGSVCIKVENTRYKVHSSLLKRHSPQLNTKLSAVMPGGTRRKKETKQSWDLLLEARSEHFDLLLSMIYPSELGSLPQFSQIEWLSLLEVSSQLNFPAIRKAAINYVLSTITDPLELTHIGMSLQIKEILEKSFHILCTRGSPLTHEEGHTLGVSMVVELAKAREDLLKSIPWEVVWKRLHRWAIPNSPSLSPRIL